MCNISDKIKFCTCISEETKIEELDNYWILYRLKESGLECLIGSFYLPDELAKNFESNKKEILKRLKDIEAFDIPITFKNEDKLVIYLDQIRKNDFQDIIYSFTFKNGRWKYTQYDPLELEGSYNEIKSGNFNNLFKND